MRHRSQSFWCLFSGFAKGKKYFFSQNFMAKKQQQKKMIDYFVPGFLEFSALEIKKKKF